MKSILPTAVVAVVMAVGTLSAFSQDRDGEEGLTESFFDQVQLSSKGELREEVLERIDAFFKKPGASSSPNEEMKYAGCLIRILGDTGGTHAENVKLRAELWLKFLKTAESFADPGVLAQGVPSANPGIAEFQRMRYLKSTGASSAEVAKAEAEYNLARVQGVKRLMAYQNQIRLGMVVGQFDEVSTEHIAEYLAQSDNPAAELSKFKLSDKRQALLMEKTRGLIEPEA